MYIHSTTRDRILFWAYNFRIFCRFYFFRFFFFSFSCGTSIKASLFWRDTFLAVSCDLWVKLKSATVANQNQNKVEIYKEIHVYYALNECSNCMHFTNRNIFRLFSHLFSPFFFRHKFAIIFNTHVQAVLTAYFWAVWHWTIYISL